MPSSVLFRAAVLPAVVLPLAACGHHEPRPPFNVVLISIDTLRADRLNCYGYRARQVSPAIDALAADSVLFENHVAASPWTTPSHLSLLTSLSPSAHGVTASFARLGRELRSGAFERLQDEHETLAEALARAGYATAAFTGGVTLDPRIGFDQGFASYDTSMAKLSEANVASLTDWMERHKDVKFFVFWHTFEVHAPYLEPVFLRDVAPPERAARVAESLARLRAVPGLTLAAQKAREVLEEHGLFTRRVCAALYDGGVRSTDRWLGKLVQALERLGLYERTLLVLTSDHGEQMGERDGRFYNTHGHNLYEEMLRVPLVIKLPGQQRAGRRVSAVSRAIDVMPTILDVLGVSPSADRMQGASLRPLWVGSGQSREAFSEALAYENEAKSLRTDRHKYTLLMDAEQVARGGRARVPDQVAGKELYDLVVDPRESRNLLESPSAEIGRLAARLDAELRRLSAERTGTAGRTQLNPETLDQLRALGYAQ